MPSVFVTGSSRGIGRDVAKRLVGHGWTVGVHGRNSEAVEALASELGELAHPFAFDINDSTALGQALISFSKVTGALDAVVHSAGVMKDAPLGLLGPDLIDEVFDTNTVSSLNVIQLSSRIMSRKKSGAIVLVNSVVGLDGAPGQTLYSMSKASLSGLVKSTAKELGPRGIRVNAIAPGLIQTELIAGLSDELLAKQTERIPLGRLGITADISPVVEFLISPGASYVTGQTLRVDGGYTV